MFNLLFAHSLYRLFVCMMTFQMQCKKNLRASTFRNEILAGNSFKVDKFQQKTKKIEES